MEDLFAIIIVISPTLLFFGFLKWLFDKPTNDLKKEILKDYPYMYTNTTIGGSMTIFISKEEYLKNKDHYDKHNVDHNGNTMQLIHVTNKAQIPFVKSSTDIVSSKSSRKRIRRHAFIIDK